MLKTGDQVIIRDGGPYDGSEGEVLSAGERWAEVRVGEYRQSWPYHQLRLLWNSKTAPSIVEGVKAEWNEIQAKAGLIIEAADKRAAVLLARRAVPILEAAMPLELRAAWETVKKGLGIACDALGVCDD